MHKDIWLWAYALIALAALSLTSVATFVFFDYLLAGELALAATVVLAAGIPVLKWAARFERDPMRARLLWGALLAFLGVELVAQYFKGQAAFAPAVQGRAELMGSDLAAAAADPLWSRLLAVVFLASLPLVVVLMVDRIADRTIALRSHVVGVRRFATIRRRVARMRRSLRESARGMRETTRALAVERDEAASLREALASAQGEATSLGALSADLRAQLAAEREQHASLRDEAASIRDWLATEREQHASLRDEAASLRGSLVSAQGEAASLGAMSADLRAQLARACDDRDHARGLAVQLRAELDRERSRPVLSVETAAALLIQAGAPEATIRGWQTAGRLQLVEREGVSGGAD